MGGGGVDVENDHLDEIYCEDGGRALRRAFAEHDANLPNYRERARALLERLDPEGEENVRIYTAAIEALYA